ncbi:transporter substrate-binding domain-containing protein [Aliikangiella marina]|uniref:Transporter substrate-binding domain-containing protein n=1 Tax=Aliikangiella marina TaxID=1712262 RepID=A0A545T4E7_9GAMM|nr:transporter substrate-binding domain-containing protein [Aliikangiella marina]TQV72012.1 transporter substrate-binding domain-containing protein [Aliikangiella marina]TQV72065.1 transporter substrate-binding domain-containing protein [Aliikangiella marina]
MKKLIYAILTSLILLGCDSTSPSKQNKNDEANNEQASEAIAPLATTALKTTAAKQTSTRIPNQLRNWQAIKASGTIRALKLAFEEEDSLPRLGSSTLYHEELLKQFADNHQLKIEWIFADNLTQMFAMLANDEADLIARHLTITKSRQASMLFTLPIKKDREVVITRKENAAKLTDNLIITVPKDTAYIESIKRHHPNWQINTIDESLSAEQISDALIAQQFDYSVIDKSAYDTLIQYRQDIKIIATLPTKSQLAWVVNLGNTSVLNKINEFIALQHVAEVESQSRQLDLDRMKKQGLPLRMITRNSPETYFLLRGELMGFEYELMREFAKRNALKLEIIVADSLDEMTTLLREGKGDIIAAGLSRTAERKSEIDLAFSIRYKRVSELMVAHKDSAPINALADLKGRTINVRPTSAFWSTAQELAKEYGANVASVEETISTEMLIGQVAEQTIDLTIADSNLVSIEMQFRDDIVTPLTLNESIPYSYLVRKNNPNLLNAINGFIRKEYRKTFYNVVKNKYFSDQKRQQRHREQRITQGSTLSPFDDIVKEKSSKFQFDWRLIVSQMYQESRFNPKAKSNAGALGLMQVLPRTGKELGFTDLTDPVQSIHAGVQYMNWTRQRFSQDMPTQERLFFALAAYNAGFGHVRDAQRIAKELNLDPNKWFGNVAFTATGLL